MATCYVCGDPATVVKRYEDFCQFHWDCLQHERMIVLRAIAQFGQYCRDNRGPRFGTTYYGYLHSEKEHGPQYTGAGNTTHGGGLLLAYTPKEAMEQSLRLCKRNGWILLRLDVQGAADHRLYGPTCTNLFVSPDYTKYMEYTDTPPLPYDAARFGELTV